MRRMLLICVMITLSCGCESSQQTVQESERETTRERSVGPTDEFELKILENGEPSHITVQHVLVAFDGSLPGQPVARTQAEAEELAGEILERAQAGEDFSELVKQYTDDKPPGIYKMANVDQATDMRSDNRTLWIRPRTQMAKGFGDVSFGLDVNQIGMAEYNQSSSPYGWHIIKRIR